MFLSKEDNIQEAIRLVQECNYSRRKAASSTGISPNTLKRRLNGSIPREEYLEKTKKITASEELILENMIISLIQHGEHVKASTLRVLVALYIKNKTAPTEFEPTEETGLEVIPKGWCSRFMKRSKNLNVNQGLIEVVDENAVKNSPELPAAFMDLLKPPVSESESLLETQQHIVDNASAIIQGFNMDFDSVTSTCTVDSEKDQLLSAIGDLTSLFKDVIKLAIVLNLTSQVNLSKFPSEGDSLKKGNHDRNNGYRRSEKKFNVKKSNGSSKDSSNGSASSISSTSSSSSNETQIDDKPNGNGSMMHADYKNSNFKHQEMLRPPSFPVPSGNINTIVDTATVDNYRKRRVSLYEVPMQPQAKKHISHHNYSQSWGEFEKDSQYIHYANLPVDSMHLTPVTIRDQDQVYPTSSFSPVLDVQKQEVRDNEESFSSSSSLSPVPSSPFDSFVMENGISPKVTMYFHTPNTSIASSTSVPVISDDDYSFNLKNQDFINLNFSSIDGANSSDETSPVQMSEVDPSIYLTHSNMMDLKNSELQSLII